MITENRIDKTLKIYELKDELAELKNNNLEKSVEFGAIKAELEFLESEENSSLIEKYRKGYQCKNIEECVEAILEMGKEYGEKFARVFLISDCLKSPLSRKYKEEDHTFLLNVIKIAISKAKEENRTILFELEEFLLYLTSLHNNNKINSEHLKSCKFNNLGLADQIMLIGSFIEGQNRLMIKEINKKIENNKFMTGQEAEISDRKLVLEQDQINSISDQNEARLESFDALIKYLYFLKEKQLKYSDVEVWKNLKTKPIDHLWDSFTEILSVAAQRVGYVGIEEKFRFSQWKIILYIPTMKSHMHGQTDPATRLN